MKHILFVILCLLLKQPIDSTDCIDSIFTPIDWPGPPLSIDTELLSKALTCFGNLMSTTPNNAGPILFVPGSGAKTAASQYNLAWTLELNKLNWPYCLLDPPDHGLGDIQNSAEYVVYAIRQMYKRTNNHRINIIGHSQGGMTPRWALRFWPDTRSMVNNMIGLAPANHRMSPQFLNDDLPPWIPARWQFSSNSQAMCALNSFQETFNDEIAYTQIMTQYDDAILPINASELTGGVNIYIQDLCSNNRVNHLGIGIFDQTAYLITMDALTNDGSASLTRLERTTCQNKRCCQQLFMSSFNQTLTEMVYDITFISNSYAEKYPKVNAEPELKCYTKWDCVLALNLSTSTVH